MVSLLLINVNKLSMDYNIVSFLSLLKYNFDSNLISNNIRNEAKILFPELFSSLSQDDSEYFWNVTQLPDKIPVINYNESEIKLIIEDILIKSNKKLPLPKKINIIVLPTFYKFFLEELDGVMGYAPTIGGTIFISINTSTENWKKSLQDTIAHEYHHVIIHEYHNWETIGQILIFEGLAEYFRDEIVGGKKSPWIEKINKEYEKTLISFVPEFANNWNQNAFLEDSQYDALFMGDEIHPQWLGYSLGYIIIRDIQEKYKFSWIEITKKEPLEIWQLWLDIKKDKVL